MNNYAYLIKAKAKATEAKSIFCWFSAKSDSRADREILNILEDEGITVGRAADYQLPIRTNFPVLDDLPVESVQRETRGEQVVLNQIIDRRLAAMKPVGVLTNLNHDELTKILGERVMDRLTMDGGIWVNFTWGSYRKNVTHLRVVK